MNLDQVNALKAGDRIMCRPGGFMSAVPCVVVSTGLPLLVKRSNGRGKQWIAEFENIQSIIPIKTV